MTTTVRQGTTRTGPASEARQRPGGVGAGGVGAGGVRAGGVGGVGVAPVQHPAPFRLAERAQPAPAGGPRHGQHRVITLPEGQAAPHHLLDTGVQVVAGRMIHIHHHPIRHHPQPGCDGFPPDSPRRSRVRLRAEFRSWPSRRRIRCCTAIAWWRAPMSRCRPKRADLSDRREPGRRTAGLLSGHFTSDLAT